MYTGTFHVRRGYFESLAAQMRNYMIRIIKMIGYKPPYYNPEKEIVILRDHSHIALFFWLQICRML